MENDGLAAAYNRYLKDKEVALRDGFAGSALKGLLSISPKATIEHINELAGLSYKLADAMMEARKND